jgi:hypothetical protein
LDRDYGKLFDDEILREHQAKMKESKKPKAMDGSRDSAMLGLPPPYMRKELLKSLGNEIGINIMGTVEETVDLDGEGSLVDLERA